MKLYPNNLNDIKHQAYLLHGPDSGQIRQVSNKLCEQFLGKKDELAITKITAEQVIEDPSILTAEFASMGFFVEKKVTIIEDASDKLNKPLQQCLPELNNEVLLVVLAGELTAKSSLRKTFEPANNIAAIACYKPEGANLNATIKQLIDQHKLQIDNTGYEYLQQNLSNDSAVIQNEFTKLSLYAGEAKTLTANEIEQILGKSAENDMFKLATYTALGNSAGLERILQSLYAENQSAIAIMRIIAWYYNRLYEVLKAAQNSNLNAAMSSIRPPLFGKQQQEMQQVCKHWDYAKTNKALQLIYEAELEVKKNYEIAEMVCRDYLLKLVRM